MHHLTPAEAALIRTSFDDILAHLDEKTDLAQRIYLRLFELAPNVRHLFRPSMRAQEEKLVAMLARLVGALRDEQHFKTLTKALGTHHKDYGVKPEHYPVLKQAIVLALKDVAPHEFPPDTLAAWGKLYDAVAEGMMAA